MLSRVLVCWNTGVALFIGLIFFWMIRLNADQICKKYIEEDELVEVTPVSIRLRKQYLTENERKRFGRKKQVEEEPVEV